MSNSLLSQEEIDALLNGVPDAPALSEADRDLLGEIGNISMGSASTALSTIINKMVNITTPKVTTTTLNSLKGEFEVPIIALEVQYTEGLVGENLLLIKITDAAIIADLMMGGDGIRKSEELTEIEISAVSEAMNQMIGSSATSLATMLNMPINISPPEAKVWDDSTLDLSKNINGNEEIVKIAFKLTIGDLVDSEIMLLLPVETANAIIKKMSGEAKDEVIEVPEGNLNNVEKSQYQTNNQVKTEMKYESAPEVNVQRAQFAPLTTVNTDEKHNIDLILDVPLEISVVLGRTKKTIKEILELGTGSLVELDKLTEEPVEILVNGKKVALGEVVVVDENFGVRITNIISNVERVKSLQNK